jgi:nitroimidazol reductase NimA-like FMN-containing flavoprotein (pyridoxamine 5'-phosphate oxidase superfamily)
MNSLGEQKAFLRDLFESQRLAVLATSGKGHPHTSLMAFAATDDLKTLIFATTRSTRKFANLTVDPRASALVDNRSNWEPDFQKAVAVTARGAISEVSSRDKKPLLKLYLSKHPHLEDFATSPSSALIQMKVNMYYIVTQFQNVIELCLDR